MLEQLDLSPMVVVLLLLYGLLLAVCLVVWTALDMGGRRGSHAADRSAATGQSAAPVRAQPEVSDSPALRDHRRGDTGKQAGAGMPVTAPASQAAAVPLRRAADSDSVVSYSVKPRVNAPAAEPAAASERPFSGKTAETPVQAPEPARDFNVGRNSRQPRSGSTVNTVKPAAGLPEQQAARPRKGEDAFERFLRSSQGEGDDY